MLSYHQDMPSRTEVNTTMGISTRRAVTWRGGLALLAIVAGVALTEHGRDAIRRAQLSLAEEPYSYYTAEDHPGEVRIMVRPSAEGAAVWTAYKSASDQRVDTWVANPQQAPTIVGRPMILTFTHPLTRSQLSPILQAGNFEVTYYALVGTDQSEDQASEYGPGPVDYSLIGVPIRDPECDWSDPDIPCYEVTYSGVMYVEGHITEDWVTALPALKNHVYVYLADTTPLHVWGLLEPTYGDTIIDADGYNAGEMTDHP
jgi:hypothetical protein